MSQDVFVSRLDLYGLWACFLSAFVAECRVEDCLAGSVFEQYLQGTYCRSLFASCTFLLGVYGFGFRGLESWFLVFFGECVCYLFFRGGLRACFGEN